MSWAGKETVYAPNGELMKTLDVGELCTLYSAHHPVVAFLNDKNEALMTTNLPFILDCPPGPVMLNDKTPPNDVATLLGNDGRVVRTFLYLEYWHSHGLNVYELPDGGMTITTFSMILKPV